MKRLAIALVAAAATLTDAHAATHQRSFTSVGVSLSSLFLYAFGTHEVPPGSIRLPIATADATYEVIVKRPGPPSLDRLDARIGSAR